MHGPPVGNDSVRWRDLGFGAAWLVSVLATCAAVPMVVVLGFGAGGKLACTCGIAAAATAGAAVALGRRRLHAQLLEPIVDLSRAMESLRVSGQAQRLAERGAALLQPLLRRFNQAVVAVERREGTTKANLLAVEVAFDRLHAVLQSLRESVVVVDPQGRVVLINRSARALLGAATRIEGAELLGLLEGELRTAVENGIRRMDGDGIAEVRTGDLPHADCILDVAIVQVQSNRPGEDFGKVVVLADVTRNHEVNRLKDGLLSSISHELRTPLTNMCSSSEILVGLTAADETEWREFATMLHAESHRLKSMVDDVMEYSQLATSGFEFRREPTDVAALVRGAAQAMHGRAAAKRLEVVVEAGAAAKAEVDPARLTEALCRVLDNAIKFTPEGGRIRVEATVHDEVVDIAVADSGVGIPPADRERVFEHFTQVGDVMTDKPQGAGLGLSITHHIVAALGGTIWCEDSPLGGAQIRILLPLLTADSTA